MCLCDADFDVLNGMYGMLYPCVNIFFVVSRLCKEAKKLIVNGEEYTFHRSRSDWSAVIVAKWVGCDGIDYTKEEQCVHINFGPIQIHY